MNHRARKAGRRHTTWSVVQQLQLFPVKAAPASRARSARARREPIDLEPVQRVIPAAGAAPLPMLGARSVFEMAPATCSAAPAPTTPTRMASRIVREDGIPRHIAVRIQDTEEGAEKERQRRARQKPPRPARQKFWLPGSVAWA